MTKELAHDYQVDYALAYWEFLTKGGHTPIAGNYHLSDSQARGIARQCRIEFERRAKGGKPNPKAIV